MKFFNVPIGTLVLVISLSTKLHLYGQLSFSIEGGGLVNTLVSRSTLSAQQGPLDYKPKLGGNVAFRPDYHVSSAFSIGLPVGYMYLPFSIQGLEADFNQHFLSAGLAPKIKIIRSVGADVLLNLTFKAGEQGPSGDKKNALMGGIGLFANINERVDVILRYYRHLSPYVRGAFVEYYTQGAALGLRYKLH